MKIERISVHQVELPLREGRYAWSEGKFVESFDSTVVAVETDTGLTGWGEVCPLGPFYLPSHGRGVRAGLEVLAPQLIGHDPRELDRLNRHMDLCLRGHPDVKSVLDMACWDLLGQDCGLPLCTLLGGRNGDDFVLYRAISQDQPEAMAEPVSTYRAEGSRRFQLKVGSDVATDIARIRSVAEVLEAGDLLIADANTGWVPSEAARIVRAVDDIDVFIEQPCASYDECLSIRRRTNHPFVLDESIRSLGDLARGHGDDAFDAVNLKISKLGGITRLRQARDWCIAMGIAMTIEDAWGGDIVTAAIAHLAHSTPPRLLLTATDFNSYVTRSIAEDAPQRVDGRMAAPKGPGLGVRPRLDVLGDPVAGYGS